MKVWRWKINSSVVIFNSGLFILMAGIYITALITGNQAILNEIFGPEVGGIIVMIASAINIKLRTSNLQGLPPIQVITPEKTQEQ